MFLNKFSFKAAYILALPLLIVAGCDTEEALLDVDAPVAISFDVDTKRIEVEETTTYDVVVSTLKAPSSDVTVNLEVTSGPDESLYNMSPSITIPAGELSGKSTLSFSHSLLEFGDEKTLKVDIAESSRSGGVILNEERASTSITFVKKCTLNDVIVSITTDQYPEETFFRLFDVSTNPSGDLLFESDTYNGNANTTVSKAFCLNAGSYAIVVYDLYQDGITGGGFSVTVNGTSAVALTPVTGASAVAFFDVE